MGETVKDGQVLAGCEADSGDAAVLDRLDVEITELATRRGGGYFPTATRQLLDFGISSIDPDERLARAKELVRNDLADWTSAVATAEV